MSFFNNKRECVFEGWGSYTERYGPTMTRVMAQLKADTNWTPEGVAKLQAQMEEFVPITQLAVREVIFKFFIIIECFYLSDIFIFN